MPEQATPLFLVYSGDALDRCVYRIVGRCPPTVEEFLSYEALGKPYDRRELFKGTGVSMHLSKSRSRRIARTYGVGRAIAALDLRDTSTVWAPTGAREHITVWAPAERLLQRVVECESHE